MSLTRKFNRKLGSITGYEIRRTNRKSGQSSAKTEQAKKAQKAQPSPPSSTIKLPAVEFSSPANPSVDRLLDRPVFIICPPRSGSTLLRLLLDQHAELHSQHELHFRRLQVAFASNFCRRSMEKLDLDRAELEHLLWDRVLHRELAESGKSRIVEKTPSNAFVHQRIAACWPDAQFIFLLRHPVASVASWFDHNPNRHSLREAETDALSYMTAVERARHALPGHTVRYEELTDDPAGTLKRICAFLDIDWEPEMLEYGSRSDDELPWALGDTGTKVRSGQVQPKKELPQLGDVSAPLREMCEAWGYQHADRPAASGA